MAARFVRSAILLFTLVVPASRGAVASDDLGFRVPDGFEVSLFADDSLAHDIFSMTIDSHGRVAVAGPGYVKLLEDADEDGRADRAVLYSALPASGAQGMYFDGDDLIATGDGVLARYREGATAPTEVWTRLANPEHGAHAVVKGPDGWFYIMCGNDAEVSIEHARRAGSPVRVPQSGAVVRFSHDGRDSDIYAHGFRNPYDLAFGPSGHIFTVDSDGERAYHLPWYAPTRLFDVAQGMEHGWIEQGWQLSWSRPACFFDNVERAAELGRGSPTGLETYQHRQFPKRYRGGLFSACWTLGRVYFLPLAARGASFCATPEIFMETTGDVGFAPVDLVVAPDGSLLVAVGGRGTRGGVFRVRCKSTAAPFPPECDALEGVLAADQPLASWSRERWVPTSRRLGREAFEGAVVNAHLSLGRRIRAVEVLTEIHGGVSIDLARRAKDLGPPGLISRVAWSLSRSECAGHDAEAILAELTHHGDPRATRAAWEALAAWPRALGDDELKLNWHGGLCSTERRVRAAAILAARGPGQASFQRFASALNEGISDRLVLAPIWVRGPTDRDIDAPLDVFGRSDDPLVRLEAVRLLQIALGDIETRRTPPEMIAGYAGKSTDQVPLELRARMVEQLASAFPTAHADTDRELGRLLAMLSADAPGLLEKIASRWSDESDPVDDVHWLIVASQLHGERGASVREQTARALAALPGKLAVRGMHPSRTWPERVGQAFDQLCRFDPALASALVEQPAFSQPEHALLAERMPPHERTAAARKLLRELGDDESQRWTPEVVTLVATLPDEEALPALRDRWNDYALRDAITQVIARCPSEEDRSRLIESLDSVDPNTVASAAAALRALRPSATPSEMARALRTLRRQAVAAAEAARADKLNGAPRESHPIRFSCIPLLKLLRHWTGESTDLEEGAQPDLRLEATLDGLFDWLSRNHPREATELAQSRTASAEAWQDRLAKVDWEAGDAARGREVFERQSCHRCHATTERLGPDLAGVATRMTRDDLFTSVLDPNRDVSPTYETTLVATRTGQVYHGLLVYESPEATLLQTSPDVTVRITNEDLALRQPSRQSIMPTGLLDPLSDRELADLYAYLKTLTAQSQ